MVRIVEAKVPNIRAIAKPPNIGSVTITAGPKMIASAVSKIGLIEQPQISGGYLNPIGQAFSVRKYIIRPIFIPLWYIISK